MPLSLGLSLSVCDLGGGAREASPSSLANLVAWGEGSDLGADTSAIASWVNKTGSGLDPAQGVGAQQPIVDAAGINGQKAAKFDGSNDTLLFSGAALGWLNNVTGATYAGVVKAASLGAAMRWLHFSTGASANAARLSADFNLTPAFQSNFRDDALNPTPSTISAGTPVVNTPYIIVATRDWVAKTVNVWANGALVASTAYTEAASASDATNSLAANLGAASGAAALLPWNGWIGSYAMYNAAYSRGQLDAVLRRWARIYGISLAVG